MGQGCRYINSKHCVYSRVISMTPKTSPPPLPPLSPSPPLLLLPLFLLLLPSSSSSSKWPHCFYEPSENCNGKSSNCLSGQEQAHEKQRHTLVDCWPELTLAYLSLCGALFEVVYVRVYEDGVCDGMRVHLWMRVCLSCKKINTN